MAGVGPNLAGVRQSRDLKHDSLNRKHGKQEGNKGNSPREFTRPGKARRRRASRHGGRRFPARVQRCLRQPRDWETEGKVHLRLRDHTAELGKQSLMAPEEHRALMATAGGLAICKVPVERGSRVWEGEMNAWQRRGLGHDSKGARHGENVGEWKRGVRLRPAVSSLPRWECENGWREGMDLTGGSRMAVREKREGGGCRPGLDPREKGGAGESWA
jgi:hypothetical protein